jgi:hypothetical protein
MPYFGDVVVSYTQDQQFLEELPDGPVFDQLVLDGAVENHLVTFLDNQFGDTVKTDDIQYEVELGGDTIIGIEYTGHVDAEHPLPEIQIPPFRVEIEGNEYEVSFSVLRFDFVEGNNNMNQNGGRRRSTRRSRSVKRSTRRRVAKRRVLPSSQEQGRLFPHSVRRHGISVTYRKRKSASRKARKSRRGRKASRKHRR